MTSYTSSFKGDPNNRGRLLRLYGFTALLVLSGAGLLEYMLRSSDAAADAPTDAGALIQSLPDLRIEGREIGNQMLVHNVALFDQHPSPEDVVVGYVGTSRSKVLRPSFMGIEGAVVGAGNSYNEISYGLLLQAEVLRLKFPNVRRVFVESSFLLRRPGRLIVEDDHRKYLPLLATLQPLCEGQPKDAACHGIFSAVRDAMAGTGPATGSALLAKRSDLRVTSLATSEEEGITAGQDSWMQSLAPNGERKDRPEALRAPENQTPKVVNENVKVQRLREIESNAPWDGLFDLFGEWGKQHGIDVVFFQPPVRSDLHAFQVEAGLLLHVQDMQRVAERYDTLFVDLNQPGLGYLEDWLLFSDEDHLETCVGSSLLAAAIQDAAVQKAEGGGAPDLSKTAVSARWSERIQACMN